MLWFKKLEYVVSSQVLFVDDMEVQRLENGGREGTSTLLKDSRHVKKDPTMLGLNIDDVVVE